MEVEDCHRTVAHVLSRRGLGCGLLLDWLSELQRETLGRQMKLMFEKGGGAWRPLLVTLLAHRASWRTLHAVLAALTDHGYTHTHVVYANTHAHMRTCHRETSAVVYCWTVH